nr:lipoprotein LpqH [Mycobacterium avium]
MIGSTYAITGPADGFKADQPSTRTSTPFAIKVSC